MALSIPSPFIPNPPPQPPHLKFAWKNVLQMTHGGAPGRLKMPDPWDKIFSD